jgi:hypothetical protein
MRDTILDWRLLLGNYLSFTYNLIRLHDYYTNSYHIKMGMIVGSALRNLLLFAIFTASCGRSIVDYGRLQYLYLLWRVWLSCIDILILF